MPHVSWWEVVLTSKFRIWRDWIFSVPAVFRSGAGAGMWLGWTNHTHSPAEVMEAGLVVPGGRAFLASVSVGMLTPVGPCCSSFAMILAVWSSGALSSCLSFPCLFFQPLADAMDPDSLPVKSLHLEEPGSVSVACYQYCHGVERHSEHTHTVSSAHHPSQPPWSHVLKCTLGLTTEIDQRGWLVNIRTYLKKSSAEETGLKPTQGIWLAQNGQI